MNESYNPAVACLGINSNPFGIEMRVNSSTNEFRNNSYIVCARTAPIIILLCSVYVSI
jgi:hypothetical protein